MIRIGILNVRLNQSGREKSYTVSLTIRNNTGMILNGVNIFYYYSAPAGAQVGPTVWSSGTFSNNATSLASFTTNGNLIITNWGVNSTPSCSINGNTGAITENVHWTLILT